MIKEFCVNEMKQQCTLYSALLLDFLSSLTSSSSLSKSFHSVAVAVAYAHDECLKCVVKVSNNNRSATNVLSCVLSCNHNFHRFTRHCHCCRRPYSCASAALLLLQN